jgi:peptidoglycan/LPS O-acetylase OafA/YrhL
MEKYLVIGDPVGHSRSPAMQNAAFEALGYLGVALFFFASGYLHPLTGWILRLPTKILQRGLQ